MSIQSSGLKVLFHVTFVNSTWFLLYIEPPCYLFDNIDNNIRKTMPKPILTIFLLRLAASYLCKQFGQSGSTNVWASSRSKLFETLIVFLKDFLKIFFLKNQEAS